MKQEIKDIRTQERQMYVPASVKVIEVTAHRVLCGSERENALNSTEMMEGDDNW